MRLRCGTKSQSKFNIEIHLLWLHWNIIYIVAINDIKTMYTFWSPEVWFRSNDLLVAIQIMQNEITVRNKIEMRVILMGVYEDEGEMDAMPCKMRLRCGTKLGNVKVWWLVMWWGRNWVGGHKMRLRCGTKSQSKFNIEIHPLWLRWNIIYIIAINDIKAM